jgi:pyrroloquinoline quinone biosynthesis protein B
MEMELVLLGLAQDGGVPQAGCNCAQCAKAHRDPTHQQWVVSLGIVDRASQASWMIDATPDFREQLHYLSTVAPECALKGIWLTHAHMGHYTGLLQVGKEAMGANELPVYATPSVCAFLQANEPWASMCRDRHIALSPIECDVPYPLAGGHIMAMAVPHRAEFSDTVAFSLSGPARRLFYCPDIDRWEQWQHDVREVVAAHDVSLVDGSFFAEGELARDMSLIPHPLVTDTVQRLHGLRDKVWFFHLNHTNPLLNEHSDQRRWLRERGFDVAATGMRWVW